MAPSFFHFLICPAGYDHLSFTAIYSIPTLTAGPERFPIVNHACKQVKSMDYKMDWKDLNHMNGDYIGTI